VPNLLSVQEDSGVKRTRKRTESLKFDKQVVAERIHKFWSDDTTDRTVDIEARIQRYAKFRMWTEGKDFPWEDSSDVGLPDMITHSLRMQDTLHNSVMSIRPAIVTKAISGKEDSDKQEIVDNLIDYQVFIEQPGEQLIGDAADAFVNDGVYTIFTPWVREDREVVDIRFFPKIPDDQVPISYFKELIVDEFPKGEIRIKGDGWDFEVKEEDKEKILASFYTRDDDKVELVIEQTVRIFEGPKPRVVDYEDLLYPKRCSNLQIPGPSNPSGAAHVILMDYPTIDEITRHQKSGFYDLLSEEDLTAIQNASMDRSTNQAPKQQKDAMQGNTVGVTSREVTSHKTLTRVLCFDMYDIDDDGLDEDVVWWMILETKTIVKAKMLTEMWPANPPRRPFAGSQFIPIRGRYAGIGLLELLESSHDTLKMVMDQTLDAGTISNAPFFFYRAASNMKPEVMRMSPGEGYPLADPQRDVLFPTFSQTAQSFGLNIMTIVGQQQDKLAMQSEASFGRVPKGQASAMRTAEGMQTLLAQGEARPERILRRFFMGLCEMWAQIHELNQRFLPAKKKFMISGYSEKEKDPYQEIQNTKQIEGRFQFDFKANVLNTSKQMMQQTMTEILSVYMNPVNVQLGLLTPDNAYRIQRDFGKARGVDPAEKQYLTPPSPTSNEPPIFYEEVIHSILLGNPPNGTPAEGAQVHLQKLMEFMQSDEIGYFQNPFQLKLFEAWMMKVKQLAIEEVKKQQLAQAMQSFSQTQGSPSGVSKPAPDMSNPPVQNNEVIDETLPSAKGEA
jgi:hypothetical protein